MRVNCRVAGRPAPDVNWHVNGSRAVQDARHKMVVNESGFHTMLVSDARMSDAGAVRCVAKNRSGVAEFQVIHGAGHRVVGNAGLLRGRNHDFNVSRELRHETQWCPIDFGQLSSHHLRILNFGHLALKRRTCIQFQDIDCLVLSMYNRLILD